jgi:hypothetical protein
MLTGLSNSNEIHQLPDDETNMMMPTDMFTMDRLNGSTRDHKIKFMTPRIAGIVVTIQEEGDWAENWRILRILELVFNDPENRVFARKKFEKMFL